MSTRLDSKPQIWTLAADLGLSGGTSPSRMIVDSVRKRVVGIAKKYACVNLNGLLTAAAGELETVFEDIRSDEDLSLVQDKYLHRGEKSFASLTTELEGPEDFAITIRRIRAKDWEPQFVSVIDCRGPKLFRGYFSKWHELAHLLTLTPQMRFVFRRTHAGTAARDPEEILMDVIAGEIGFLRDFMPGEVGSDISFEGIRRIRDEYCPEASMHAALIGIVKAIPVPCILLEASMALRRREKIQSLQKGLGLGEQTPAPSLRAVHVTVNNSAKEAGICFPWNWRVPEQSVITAVHVRGGYAEALEDLSCWSTSGGSGLAPCPVFVKARENWGSVQALLSPEV